VTDDAGWGLPDFLPPRVVRRALRDDARETIAARQAEEERERLAEARHSRAVALHCEMAEARGEDISAVAIATGRFSGRSVLDILAAAGAAGDRQDVIDQARLYREGAGDPAPLHVEVGEPRIISSPVKRSIASRSRHWQAWRERVAEAEAARLAVRADREALAHRNDLGIAAGTLRARP
jgi:hypothetical protein